MNIKWTTVILKICLTECLQIKNKFTIILHNSKNLKNEIILNHITTIKTNKDKLQYPKQTILNHLLLCEKHPCPKL